MTPLPYQKSPLRCSYLRSVPGLNYCIAVSYTHLPYSFAKEKQMKCKFVAHVSFVYDNISTGQF